MAKILLGPTVIGIRGTVAGITFSNNKGGPYARGWHKPPNPRSASQRTSQVNLGVWAVNWRGLSAANQVLWNNYAAAAAQILTDSLGQPYNASGMNWFATVNIARAQMGLAQLSTAPTVAAPVAPTSPFCRFRTTANATLSTVRVTLATPTIALRHQVWVNIVNSKGVNVAPDTAYLMVTAIPDGTGNISFGTQQATKFGTTVNTQRMFLSINALSTEGRYGASVFLTDDGRDVG